MARRRKQTNDPRQLSLFDVMATQIEEIREENIQDDMREEAAPPAQDEQVQPASAVPEAEQKQGFSFPTQKAERTLLGINGNGESVYEMRDGSRMHSRDPNIMQVMDGEKRTPEKLFEAGADNWLTIQEIHHFMQTLPREVQHARQTNVSAGNRKKGSQARNNQRREKRGLYSPGLLDFGSLGAEQPGRVEEAGSDGSLRLRSEAVRPATDGSAGVEQRDSETGEPAGDVGLRDIAEHGHRHEPENYRISPEDRLGVGGAKTKYADNVAAIRLLQQLQASNAKLATPEEQKTLVRYVGWGGLPQVFDPKNEQWASEYREMQGLLSPDLYAAARRSTQDAHYTSETVIQGTYQGLSRLSLGTGAPLRILEPSAGIGNFIGLCPESFNASFMAVELDPTTSAIAQYLYPEAKHLNTGFQNSLLRSDDLDAVVGKASSVDRAFSMGKLCKKLGDFEEGTYPDVLGKVAPEPVSSVNLGEWKAYQTAFAGVPNNAKAAENADLARMKERHRDERKRTLSRLARYGLPVLNIARHCLMAQQREERRSLRSGRKKACGGKPRFETWLRTQGLFQQADRWRHRAAWEQARHTPPAPQRTA